MASQFEQIMRLLKTMHTDIIDLTREVREMKGEDLDLGGDAPYEEELPPPDPRTTVMVKDVDGEEFAVDWNTLEPKMQEAITLSQQTMSPYQLYQDDGGRLRIMVANEVAAKLHQRHTPQPRKGDR